MNGKTCDEELDLIALRHGCAVSDLRCEDLYDPCPVCEEMHAACTVCGGVIECDPPILICLDCNDVQPYVMPERKSRGNLWELVRECAAQFLTDVSATEIADLVADAIETMDVPELSDESESGKRVETLAA